MNLQTQQHDELSEIRSRHHEAMAAAQTIRQVLTVRDPIAQRQDAQARGIRCALHLIKHRHYAEATRVLEGIG